MIRAIAEKARRMTTVWVRASARSAPLEQEDDLRHALLIGALPLIQLERLSRNLAARRSGIDDPRLAEVVGEIELRAAVELAKLGR
jgi:Class II flagellar assembly regulator